MSEEQKGVMKMPFLVFRSLIFSKADDCHSRPSGRRDSRHRPNSDGRRSDSRCLHRDRSHAGTDTSDSAQSNLLDFVGTWAVVKLFLGRCVCVRVWAGSRFSSPLQFFYFPYSWQASSFQIGCMADILALLSINIGCIFPARQWIPDWFVRTTVTARVRNYLSYIFWNKKIIESVSKGNRARKFYCWPDCCRLSSFSTGALDRYRPTRPFS